MAFSLRWKGRSSIEFSRFHFHEIGEAITLLHSKFTTVGEEPIQLHLTFPFQHTSLILPEDKANISKVSHLVVKELEIPEKIQILIERHPWEPFFEELPVNLQLHPMQELMMCFWQSEKRHLNTLHSFLLFCMPQEAVIQYWNDTLQSHACYKWEHEEDLLYYIMLQCREYSISPSSVSIYCCGRAPKLSSFLSLVKKYGFSIVNRRPNKKHRLFLDVNMLEECV